MQKPALALLMGVTLVTSAAAADRQGGYGRYLVDIPETIVDTVFADADGDGLDDIWLAGVRDGRRLVALFLQRRSGGYAAEPDRVYPVPRAVVAWAVGEFDRSEESPGAELLLTTREAVYLQSGGGRPRRIHDVPLLLDLPAADDLPAWKEVADLDGDGLDEIALPTREGYRILHGDGSLMGEILWRPVHGRAPVAQRDLFGGRARATLSSSQLSELFVPNESVGVIEQPPLLYSRVTLPRLVLDDLDGDGRGDVSFLSDGQIRIYLQKEDSSFRATPDRKIPMPPGKGSNTEILDWRHVGGGASADLLLVRSDSGLGLSSDWQVRLWFDVLDQPQLGQPAFFRKAEGGWAGPYLRDVDGDGLTDIAISAWELDLGLTLRDPRIRHSMQVFRGTESGFDTRAALSHERSYAVGDVDSFSVVPSLVADFDGDGLPDLLENSGNGDLEVRPLYRGGRLAVRPAVRTIPVDALAAVVEVRDLNHDGLGDLLVREYSHWEIYLSRP